MTEGCTRKTCHFLQSFIFQPKPVFRKFILIIRRVFFSHRLNTVAAAVGRKDQKSDFRRGELLLAWEKLGKNQNLFIHRFRLFLCGDPLPMCAEEFRKLLLHPLIRAETFPFMLQNPAGNRYRFKESSITSAVVIPHRIEHTDQAGKLVLFTRIIIVVERLHKFLIKAFCHLGA